MTSSDPVEKSSSHRRPIGSVDVFSWDELIDGRLAAAKAVPGAVFEMVIEGSGKNGKIAKYSTYGTYTYLKNRIY